MYRIGQDEIEAVATVIKSQKLFRFHDQSHCARFEQRYGEYLGVKHVWMTSSGTTALTAALIGLGIGPGDEVIVPSHTFMSTAVAVLGAGAIPIIVDVDRTTTLDPQAMEDAIGPYTRAVIPVHMWGLNCNMQEIMRIASEHKLLVLEDACQAVGGAYQGKKVGSIGHAGAFSFNYYKNMTCGEGGALVTNDTDAFKRASCAVDCCGFYWTGRDQDLRGFIANSSRASEIDGAMMNVQLDRLPRMIQAMRRQKKRILRETQGVVTAAPCHSLDHECGSCNLFQFDDSQQAGQFAADSDWEVLIKTGRHVYTEWDAILNHRGAHHPALNPFNLPQNSKCRKNYSPDMCRRSLDILERTVKVPNHPDHTREDVTALIRRIKNAAKRATANEKHSSLGGQGSRVNVHVKRDAKNRLLPDRAE